MANEKQRALWAERKRLWDKCRAESENIPRGEWTWEKYENIWKPFHDFVEQHKLYGNARVTGEGEW